MRAEAWMKTLATTNQEKCPELVKAIKEILYEGNPAKDKVYTS